MNLSQLVHKLIFILEKLGYPDIEITNISYKKGDDYLIIENGDETGIHIPMSSFAKSEFKKEFWL